MHSITTEIRTKTIMALCFKRSLKRLWVHEVLRVYGDRLVDDNDTKWLVEQIRRTMSEYMDDNLDDLFQDLLVARADTVRSSLTHACFECYVSSSSFSIVTLGNRNGASKSGVLRLPRSTGG